MASPSRSMMLFFTPQHRTSFRKSIRLWAPRLSSRASALKATASETVSIDCKSSPRCHPGLYSREPSTLRRPSRFFAFGDLAQGAFEVFLVAEDAHELLHRVLQVAVNRIRGFSPSFCWKGARAS